MRETEYLFADPDIVFREEEDGAFLFNPEDGMIKCLNPSGALIWKLCDGKHTIEEMVDGLLGEFEGINKEVARKEIEKFVSQLDEMGLLGRIYEKG